jgi:hypothetical protein
MGKKAHRFRVSEARRTTHPVLKDIEKHWFTVPAVAFPAGISTKVNARDPVGLNRRVYRDVRESLEGKTAQAGTFDLMNKGVTILAEKVRLVDKEKNIYEVTIDDEEGGLVDGAHTVAIIEESNADGTTPLDQYVEVYIRTGLTGGIITDIARGLNTGMQVAPKSIYNIDKVFDWLKEEISGAPYANQFSWKESDSQEYDVRDLVGILELLNVFDFPNHAGKHPISAYEKWSIPLDKFATDFNAHKDNLSKSKYHRLRPLLKDGLALFDHIRRDFYEIHKAKGGAPGKMNIIEEASEKRGPFKFPFAPKLPSAKYRLTKGAAYPMLGALRNYVVADNGAATWDRPFSEILKEWEEIGPLLVEETFSATKEIGRMPDQLGKSRPHWDKLHMKVRLGLLTKQIESHAPTKKKIRLI